MEKNHAIPLDPIENEEKAETHTSIESAQESGVANFDAAIEKRIIRKCDLRVLPPVFVLFMVTFWDRINIGNAAIQGMPEELNLRKNQFNVAIMILFIPFILFEIPENIMLKKTRPYQWLSFLVLGCGIANLSMGFVHSYGALLGVRFLLGCFEAGTGAGSVLVISTYYKRYELPSKLAIWYLAGIAGGAFAGLLAYGIVRMDGDAGLSGWRWIFIIEGSITAAISILMYFWMPDWPDNSQFLTTEERSILLARLRNDRAEQAKMEHWNAKRCLGDWRVWIGTLMYLCILTSTYSFNFFAPTILVEMGYGPISAQLHSFPPYAVAAVCCLSFCMLSDRYKHRYGFLMGGVLIGTVGYGIMLSQTQFPDLPVGAKYFALFLLVSAPQIVQPLTVAWMMNNVGGHYKRAFASACQIGFGSAGGIVASNIYLTSDAPLFRIGFGVSFALLLLNGCLATALLFLLKRENRQRDQGSKDYLLRGEDADDLGDEHPDFRYTY